MSEAIQWYAAGGGLRGAVLSTVKWRPGKPCGTHRTCARKRGLTTRPIRVCGQKDT